MFLPDVSKIAERLLDILERQVEALEGIDKSLSDLSELLHEQHGDDDHI